MTGHQRGDIPFESKEDMFEAFKLSLSPYIEHGKLAMVLFQFPPWFDCKKENVAYLRWCRQQMGDIPCALEFRNRSWFSPPFYEQTLSFMKEEGWIHSICDEPQIGEGSIPTVLKATDEEKRLSVFTGGTSRAGSNQTADKTGVRSDIYTAITNRSSKIGKTIFRS